jgi:hypothetical protein
LGPGWQCVPYRRVRRYSGIWRQRRRYAREYPSQCLYLSRRCPLRHSLGPDKRLWCQGAGGRLGGECLHVKRAGALSANGDKVDSRSGNWRRPRRCLHRLLSGHCLGDGMLSTWINKP